MLNFEGLGGVFEGIRFGKEKSKKIDPKKLEKNRKNLEQQSKILEAKEILKQPHHQEKLKQIEDEQETSRQIDELLEKLEILADSDIQEVEEKKSEFKKPEKKERIKPEKIEINGEDYTEGDEVFYTKNNKTEKKYEIDNIDKKKNIIEFIDLDSGINIKVNIDLIRENDLISKKERLAFEKNGEKIRVGDVIYKENKNGKKERYELMQIQDHNLILKDLLRFSIKSLDLNYFKEDENFKKEK